MTEPLDEFHRHEAMDRLHVICCTIDDHLVCHPFVEAYPEIQEQIQEAVRLLSSAYQTLGTECDLPAEAELEADNKLATSLALAVKDWWERNKHDSCGSHDAFTNYPPFVQSVRIHGLDPMFVELAKKIIGDRGLAERQKGEAMTSCHICGRDIEHAPKCECAEDQEILAACAWVDGGQVIVLREDVAKIIGWQGSMVATGRAYPDSWKPFMYATVLR